MIETMEAERGMAYWLDLEKNTAFVEGVLLNEVRLTRVEDGWRAIVKGTRHHRPVILFFYERSFTNVMLATAHAIVDERVKWRADKYPPK